MEKVKHENFNDGKESDESILDDYGESNDNSIFEINNITNTVPIDQAFGMPNIVRRKSILILTRPLEKYEGEVDENFVRNGYGYYKYDNGDTYEGEFLNGLRHGSGEYIYSDGSIYIGYWKNDKKNGKGMYKFDEYEYDGEWTDDVLENGFSYKINKFLMDENSKGENELASEEDNSFTSNRKDFYHNNSFNDYDYKFDANEIKEILNKQYEIVNDNKYIIDLELIDFIGNKKKESLMNTFPNNELYINNEFKILNPLKMNYNCCPSDNYVPKNNYTNFNNEFDEN